MVTISEEVVIQIAYNLCQYITREKAFSNPLIENVREEYISNWASLESTMLSVRMLDRYNEFKSLDRVGIATLLTSITVDYLIDPDGNTVSSKKKLEYIRKSEDAENKLIEMFTLDRTEFDPDILNLTPLVEFNERTFEVIILSSIPKEKNEIIKPIDGFIHSLDTIDLMLYRKLMNRPELLNALNWRTFEKLVADILEELNYEIELMQGTKDGGIDVIAFKNETEFGVHKYLIQAKKWNNKVGIEPVRSLAFLHSHYNATKSCLVTTSTFTKGAWDLANEYKWQMDLKDINGLLAWMRTVYNRKI